MTTHTLLTDNTPSAPLQISGEATVFPSGTFAGAHIRLEVAESENGDYQPSEYYHTAERKNLTVTGWVRAAVGNPQPGTNLGLKINVPS